VFDMGEYEGGADDVDDCRWLVVWRGLRQQPVSRAKPRFPRLRMDRSSVL
jgi:hypothetical protein